MQHLGAGGSNFLRFVIVQTGEQARVRHILRVGAEHARHVGPDFHAAGAEQRTEVRGRGIRAATAEDGGATVFMAGDEALADQHARGLGREALLEVRLALPLAVHRQALRPSGLVGYGRQRIQPFARVHPAEIQTVAAQVGRADAGRKQFALAQHFGLPVERAAGGTRVVQQRLQRGQTVRQHLFAQLQLGEEFVVTGDQRGDAHTAVGGAIGNGRQFIGDTRKGRHHHQHAATGFIRPFFRQFPDRVPTMTTGHRGATELEDDPAINDWGSGHWLWGFTSGRKTRQCGRNSRFYAKAAQAGPLISGDTIVARPLPGRRK
ncbi:hypothetical protein D3C71_1171220 [compost metagenome]